MTLEGALIPGWDGSPCGHLDFSLGTPWAEAPALPGPDSWPTDPVRWKLCVVLTTVCVSCYPAQRMSRTLSPHGSAQPAWSHSGPRPVMGNWAVFLPRDTYFWTGNAFSLLHFAPSPPFPDPKCSVGTRLRQEFSHHEAPGAWQPSCPWGLGDTAPPETLPSCTLDTQTEGNTETGAQVFPTPNSMLLPLCTLWNCRRFLKAWGGMLERGGFPKVQARPQC